MFYGFEKAIVNYINYYNKRIKVKLKELSPVQYRTKSINLVNRPELMILWSPYLKYCCMNPLIMNL